MGLVRQEQDSIYLPIRCRHEEILSGHFLDPDLNWILHDAERL